MTDRRELLERHGRAYGELRLAVAFTVGLTGERAKESRFWQSNPHKLSTPDEGAAILAGRGFDKNPVVSLRAANVVGVDVDGPAGRLLVRKLLPGGFPATVTVQSGRADGGIHLWFRPPVGCRTHKIEFSAEGLKVSSDGYLVAPPAIHGETEQLYRFVDGHAPWEIPLATLPPLILTSLKDQRRAIHEEKRADDRSPLGPGDRHEHLLRVGCAMRRAGAREESIRAALLVENEIRCNPPKPEHTVHALAEDITTRYPPGARA